MSELFLQICRHLLAQWQQGCRPGRVDALRPKSSHHLHSLVPCSMYRDVGIAFGPSPHTPRASSHVHTAKTCTQPRTSHVHTHTHLCVPRHTGDALSLFSPHSQPTLPRGERGKATSSRPLILQRRHLHITADLKVAQPRPAPKLK